MARPNNQPLTVLMSTTALFATLGGWAALSLSQPPSVATGGKSMAPPVVQQGTLPPWVTESIPTVVALTPLDPVVARGPAAPPAAAPAGQAAEPAAPAAQAVIPAPVQPVVRPSAPASVVPVTRTRSSR